MGRVEMTMLQYLISSSRYITPSTELASPAAVLDELEMRISLRNSCSGNLSRSLR